MKIHLGNLSKEMTDAQVNELVTPFGTPKTFELAKERNGRDSRGFAFIEYETAEEANAAIAALNGKEVSGQVLKASEARPKKTADTQA
jgi:cold-inducible RNA-binding protein